MRISHELFFFFFFNDTATTEIYTLSLHDALPISEKLNEPLRWQSPKRIFVNSMSDLFQEGVPTEYIAAVGRVMQRANWHTYQVLTKRHERMRDLLSGKLNWLSRIPHILFGASVEDRDYGVPRIASLRLTPPH